MYLSFNLYSNTRYNGKIVGLVINGGVGNYRADIGLDQIRETIDCPLVLLLPQHLPLITPHANREPALPFSKEAALPPLPRSSVPSCRTIPRLRYVIQ